MKDLTIAWKARQFKRRRARRLFTRIRTAIPAVTWRMYNQGIPLHPPEKPAMTPTDFHRTNVNLYHADVEWLKKTHGFGWTERVREAIAAHVRNAKARDKATEIKRRYKDFTDD
jgi:hypothetical protein